MPTTACTIPWIESPFFQRDLEQSELNAANKELVRRYAEKGYLVIDTEIHPSVFDRVVQQLEGKFKKVQQKYAGNHHDSHRLLDAWRYNDGVQKIAANNRIMNLLHLLYRRRPIPFQTLNFNVGTQQRTHSDMIHFSSVPERYMCGVWIAFEDIDLNNGPLHLYPGSHKLPFYTLADMGVRATRHNPEQQYEDYENHYEHFISELTESLQLEKEVVQIKKGEAIIWAANLLHGGEPILETTLSRHSQVTHYYFDDCSYYTPLFTDFLLQEVALRNITDISTGKMVNNRYLGKDIHTLYSDASKPKRLWSRLWRKER